MRPAYGRRARAPAWAVLLLLGSAGEAFARQPVQDPRARTLQIVQRALAMSDSGAYPAAHRSLERSRSECGPGAPGRECRIVLASGLGALLQRQATVDRRNRDSLYRGAVAWYDTILAEAPGNPEAIYGKAVAYRAMGPHEWQERFFRDAPAQDPARGALYLTFQGDYLAATRRWSDAVRAYESAVRQDADLEGARSGVVDGLSALGRQAGPQLLQYAREWEDRYPASAASAYRAALAIDSPAAGPDDTIRDSAIVGLVRVQARNRLAVGSVPESVDPGWTPLREIRGFLRTGDVQSAPWWRASTERTAVLAQAALAGGRAAAGSGNHALAERLWRQGAQLARPTSTAALDLQHELALLYFQRPELDADGRKFESLEQEIFSGKGGALATGDLESAQRYHTTLGLIYVQRGVWRSDRFAHNAEQQLMWALEKADDRRRRERFYQPLPELKLLLARGLDSAGNRDEAARWYLEASRAFLDADDLAGADSAARRATGLGMDGAGVRTVLALRSAVARGGTAAQAACAPERLRSLGRAGDAAFLARQRFKALADCSASSTETMRREHAIAAFRLIDSARVTLVGGQDIARLERVLRSLLAPYGIAFRSAHLDASQPNAPPIQVSLPGETAPRWYATTPDDVIAARVVVALGRAARPFTLSVQAGVVTIPRSASVSRSTIDRLRRTAGVRAVQMRP